MSRGKTSDIRRFWTCVGVLLKESEGQGVWRRENVICWHFEAFNSMRKILYHCSNSFKRVCSFCVAMEAIGLDERIAVPSANAANTVSECVGRV